jgi:hypothetical protein
MLPPRPPAPGRRAIGKPTRPKGDPSAISSLTKSRKVEF